MGRRTAEKAKIICPPPQWGGHNTFVGTVAYADDVVILAPTVNALKSMLNICDDFGRDYQVLFNSNKYQLLHYSKSRKLKTLFITIK